MPLTDGPGPHQLPGGIDRVNMADQAQELTAGEANDDGGDDRGLPRMSE
jgi:hypothetical protein